MQEWRRVDYIFIRLFTKVLKVVAKEFKLIDEQVELFINNRKRGYLT